ncbi:Cytochrome P450, E-class, group I [Trema orientale]|uniref:Cytochrome P450, E-class, group I n=1 Tax=Trema orientale TaxID=63057 RepID=A0A2P5EVI8_TREOI|nr:Cytochrome P450, E-class, group I [Trema orientale]
MIVELLALFLVIFLLIRPLLTSIFRTNRLPPSPIALPIIGHFHLLGPIIHRSFQRLTNRYGPVISLRLGSIPCIVVSSPDLAREFLKTNEANFSAHNASIAIDRLTYASGVAFAPYGPYFKFIKKLTINELLGSRPVSSFASLRAKERDRFLRLLAEKSERGEAVNLTEELPKLSNNVVSLMVLGTSNDRDHVDEARLVIKEVTKVIGEFNLSDFVWFLRNVDLQGIRKRIEATFKRYDALLEKVISDREELRRRKKMNKKDNNDDNVSNNSNDGLEVKDFLDILLDNMEDENAEIKLTRAHIKGIIVDYFTAGTDTTAITTEWALAELINHPKVLEKAREEIDRVVGKSRLVSESDSPDLPYIQAILKETLRLHPPLPLLERKCVKECKIGEYVIPENAMLFVNNWAMARDPKTWESPLDFRPERFLQASSEPGEHKLGPIDVKGHHFQLLPFGSGRRMCPGVNLATQMLPALLANIIQLFDLTVAGSPGGHLRDGNDQAVLNMEEGPGFTAPRLHELVCVPVSRLSSLTTILES